MGATVWGDKVYISRDLNEQISTRERRVLLAHEVWHYKNRDRVRLVLAHILLGLLTTGLFYSQFFIPGVFVMIMFRPVILAYQRHLELQADKYAIEVTQDRDAFLSLMDKLEHNGPTHPSKDERIALANHTRLIYEYD
jgi:Zn-dependent protease with chaperone function